MTLHLVTPRCGCGPSDMRRDTTSMSVTERCALSCTVPPYPLLVWGPSGFGRMFFVMVARELASTPLLILANKIDLKPHISEPDLIKGMCLCLHWNVGETEKGPPAKVAHAVARTWTVLILANHVARHRSPHTFAANAGVRSLRGSYLSLAPLLLYNALLCLTMHAWSVHAQS